MGDFQYFDIILFAMIAASWYCGSAAFSVGAPGTNGVAIYSCAVPRRPPTKPGPKRWRLLPDPEKEMVTPALGGKPADAMSDGLSRIQRADPGFDPSFLEGARAAFEMIVSAYAKGDKAALRPLLSDEVYQPFAATIDERAAAKETFETRDLHLEDAEIVDADLSGRTARVTVKLVSHQSA